MKDNHFLLYVMLTMKVDCATLHISYGFNIKTNKKEREYKRKCHKR